MRQYPIMDEPTRGEFIAFYKVERYFEEMRIAEWLDGHDAELDGDGFVELVNWFHEADFSAEEDDVIRFMHEEIARERSGR